MKVRLVPADAAVVRKAWEIGTDEIAIQSVLQLSGDSVTRIAETYANMDIKALHGMHLNNLKTGVETWTTLASLVKDILSDAFSALRSIFRF